MLIPCRTTDKARDLAERLYSYVFSFFGLPHTIVSDNDILTSAKFFRSLAALMGIRHLSTTVNHPEANGRAEAKVKTVKERLQTLLEFGSKDKWAARLAMVQLSINSAISSATGFSPLYTLTGAQPFDPLALAVRQRTNGMVDNVEALNFVLARHAALLEIKTDETQRREQIEAFWSRKHPHRRMPEVGEQVYVAAEGLSTKSATDKLNLAHPWVGPCKVVAVDKPNVSVELPPAWRGKQDVFHLK